MKKSVLYILSYGLLLSGGGCRKFSEVSPPSTSLAAATVYGSNATASAAVTGIYFSMSTNSVGGGTHGITALLGLSADEFNLYSNATDMLISQAYVNALLSTNAPSMWNDLYNIIYQANSAIEGILNSQGVSADMKNQLIGESEFIRAFCYFYLVNLYGNVPLVLTTNYQENQTISRDPQQQVYQQMISDLLDAKGKLSNNYLSYNGSVSTVRIRPNSAAATALLARVYLYTDSLSNAVKAANEVIGNSAFILDSNLNNVFVSTSQEAIWQLQAPYPGSNTPDGGVFLINMFGGPSGFYPYLLADPIVFGFEPGDLRRVNWIDSMVVGGSTYYFPYKYKLYYTGQPATEYATLLRLGEQYLIRAEAKAEAGDLNGATSDLNAVRKRAGLGMTSATTQQQILAAIMRERRFELFTEYGHRWLDLKRTGQVDSVMNLVTPTKGGSWASTAQWYPIPILDIETDPKMQQNQGYQ